MHDFVYSALPSLNEFQWRWGSLDVSFPYILSAIPKSLYTAVLKHTYRMTYL